MRTRPILTRYAIIICVSTRRYSHGLHDFLLEIVNDPADYPKSVGFVCLIVFIVPKTIHKKTVYIHKQTQANTIATQTNDK